MLSDVLINPEIKDCIDSAMVLLQLHKQAVKFGSQVVSDILTKVLW